MKLQGPIGNYSESLPQIVNPSSYGLGYFVLYITGGGTPQTDLGDEAHAVTAEGKCWPVVNFPNTL
jgi:hypothetical protein